MCEKLLADRVGDGYSRPLQLRTYIATRDKVLGSQGLEAI